MSEMTYFVSSGMYNLNSINEGRCSLIRLLFAGWRLVARVSSAVARDALCVNNMECGGKCVLFTLTEAYELRKMTAKYFKHTFAN